MDSQIQYWTVPEAAVVFRPLTEQEIRDAIRSAGVQPAGTRPHTGRGRSPLVYAASDLCELLA
jgi:hypothetical protein